MRSKILQAVKISFRNEDKIKIFSDKIRESSPLENCIKGRKFGKMYFGQEKNDSRQKVWGAGR